METLLTLFAIGCLSLFDFAEAYDCYISCPRGQYCCGRNKCCGLSTAASAGISIGVTIIILIIIGVVITICVRRRRLQQNIPSRVIMAYPQQNVAMVPQSQFPPAYITAKPMQAAHPQYQKGAYPVGSQVPVHNIAYPVRY